MKYIMLCRIGGRSIYGQIITVWVRQTESNRIVIIDGALAKDVFLQKIIKAAVPSDARIDIYSIENEVCKLKEEAEDKERTTILVRAPQVAEALTDEDILLDRVILGGIGAKSGRKKLNRNVSASEEEIECMQHIVNKRIPMYYQLVSNGSPSGVGKMVSGQERRSTMGILQAVSLEVIYYLGSSSIITGPVGYYSVYRSLVSGCLTGVILGDPAQGTMIGVTIGLIYVGFTSTGGILPGDMYLIDILGAALGITDGLDTEAALAIVIPIGLIGTLLWFGHLTLNLVFACMADHLAEKGETGKVWIPSVLLPQLMLFVLTFIPCMLACYFGASYTQGIIDVLGRIVLNVLMIIGGVILALSISLTLMYIFKGKAKIFFFIGFLISVYSGLSMTTVGFISLCIAIVYTQKEESTGDNVT